MQVHFACEQCSRPVEAGLEADVVPTRCSECGREKELGPSESIVQKNQLDVCTLCGCKLFYVQRDFNRKVGLGIVVIGAIFSIFTYGISLMVCALIDFLLYRYLPQVTVCYRCQCVYRGFAPNPSHQPYDIHTAEIFAHEKPS